MSFPSDAELYAALNSGGVAAVLQDLPVNLDHTDDGNYEIVEEYDTDESYGFAVKEDGSEDLLAAINDNLQALRDSGDYDTIYEKYFSDRVTLNRSARSRPPPRRTRVKRTTKKRLTRGVMYADLRRGDPRAGARRRLGGHPEGVLQRRDREGRLPGRDRRRRQEHHRLHRDRLRRRHGLRARPRADEALAGGALPVGGHDLHRVLPRAARAAGDLHVRLRGADRLPVAPARRQRRRRPAGPDHRLGGLHRRDDPRRHPGGPQGPGRGGPLPGHAGRAGRWSRWCCPRRSGS